jgi:hypothetical protein
MKAPKNFEAVFLAASVLLTFTAYATAEVPVVRAPATVQTSVAADHTTQVVMVKAKRLSAAEKAAM